MDHKKHSVLVVDDTSLSIMALTRILNPEYTVYTASNGRDAITAAEQYLPDVILLDVIMPDMDGYAAIAALKNAEKTKDIPIIFITGLSRSGDEEKGLALGAADYITKPFSPVVVKLRVRNQIKILEQVRLIVEKEVVEQNNSARMEFLSRMSHEMLTPMNAIVGLTHLLKATTESGAAKEYLDEMTAASGHLLDLINNLLDISDQKDSVFIPVDSVFSFEVMVQDVLSGINHNVKKKQQRLTFDIASSLPPHLIGDPGRLAQVIKHLLANAIKFTPEDGEIRLSVSVIDEDDETVTLQFEITDNGIGISKEHQNGIFDVFTQVDESMTRKHDGAGLGLSMSKRIIEMMDGKIWVESELGKGSKFIFTCKCKKDKVHIHL